MMWLFLWTSCVCFAFFKSLRKAAAKSMAERQVLLDAIHIGWPDELVLPQRPASAGAFALEQMALACAFSHHFAGAGDFETFGD